MSTMYTIEITLPGGRIATKKLKGADETSKEVERVTQQMLGDFGGGIVKAFHPDGSPFMTMEF
jgi:hypothetical protein